MDRKQLKPKTESKNLCGIFLFCCWKGLCLSSQHRTEIYAVFVADCWLNWNSKKQTPNLSKTDKTQNLKCSKKTTNKWNSERKIVLLNYLFSHPDHNIRITAYNISHSKIHSFFNMNSQQSHQVLHLLSQSLICRNNFGFNSLFWFGFCILVNWVGGDLAAGCQIIYHWKA